ncbi:hypothetical protein [Streptomyces californicus]|uniref:hypothetical protein n=1 Tax=Streptomyces californicus TaxID=67351 RepID=UPI003787D4BD
MVPTLWWAGRAGTDLGGAIIACPGPWLPSSPGVYGPQPMRGTWFEGRESELTVLRWQYTP